MEKPMEGPWIRVIQYSTTGSEYIELEFNEGYMKKSNEYEGKRLSFVDAKQLLVLQRMLPQLMGKKDMKVRIWSPYRAMIYKVELELEDLLKSAGLRKAPEANAHNVIEIVGSEHSDRKKTCSIIMLVEPSWEFFSKKPDPELPYLAPVAACEDLFDAGSVIVIVPSSFVFEPRKPQWGGEADKKTQSKSKAAENGSKRSYWPARATYGPSLERLIEDFPILEASFEKGKASFEDAHLVSFFDNYPLRKKFDDFLKVKEFRNSKKKDGSTAESLGAEIMGETIRRYIAWQSSDQAMEPVKGECDHHYLRLLCELPFRFLEARRDPSSCSGGERRCEAPSDLRFDRRFDFAFVCGHCERLLLAVEIDGGFHRQNPKKDREKDVAICDDLHGMYLHSNERENYEKRKKEHFDKTGFTVLRLRTNGESCFEIDGSDDFVSVFEVLRDRLEGPVDAALCSYVKTSTVSELPLGLGENGELIEQKAEVDDSSVAQDKDQKGLSPQEKNNILEEKGFIEKTFNGWKPVNGRWNAGIVQSLFGEELSSSCVYLRDAVKEILKEAKQGQ